MARRVNHGVFVAMGLVLAVSLSMVAAGPAQAALAAPGGLTPSGSTANHLPVLSWNRVSGAVRYDVQASTSSAFSDQVFSKGTANHRAAVTSPLPTALVYWRVRGVSAANVDGPWATATVNVTPTPGPTLLSPANGGAVLVQPTNPPLLSWNEVPGATAYQIEVDSDSDFIGATTYRTYTTSDLVPDTKVDGTYNWHVRAEMGSGLFTTWSAVRTYTIGPLTAVTTRLPANDPDIGVTDVVFDWDPIPGAKQYQLRIDNDISFNSPIESPIVESTRYSPPTTYSNDQYYWQVRAINLNGEFMNWDSVPIQTFKRWWPLKPVLQYPANTIGTPAGDDFFYQWTPVAHASHYQLEVGTDTNFSPGTFRTCQTDSTTYTPGSRLNDACMPAQGRVYYWRVLPIDAPSGVPGIYSDIHAFAYDSGRVMQVSPAAAATVAVPALSWQASQDAERYHVEIKNSSGNQVAGVDTYALSWTPASKLDPTGGPFTWTVQAYDADSNLSPKYSGRTFSLAGSTSTGAAALTPLTPTTGSGSHRFPALSWEPLPGADHYRIMMALHGSPYEFREDESPLLSTNLYYPSATDWGARFMSPESYDWWVVAYDNQNGVLGTGVPGNFVILDLDETGGLQVALSGTALNAGNGCTAFLSDTSGDPTSCDGAPSTPVLDWEPVPDASYYMVYLSRDRSFTNIVYDGVETSNSRWTPTRGFNPSSLPDNNAGTAYYWLVRPCKAHLSCAPDPLSTSDPSDNSFSKQSPQVTLTSPANGSTAANDVHFDWTDYRTTNEQTTWLATGEQSQQSGQRYRIEVSPKETFSSDVYAQEVDQTTFTVFSDTLPEGTLNWRVQAIDSAGNRLRWSEVRSFTKSSPTPTLTSPVFDSIASSAQAFRWDPLTFAGRYQIQVYRNGDTAFSDANQVFSSDSNQSVFTYDRPLAPATLPYIWRVRRQDSRGKPGGWSSTGRFLVSGDAPDLGSPASGAYVASKDAYFEWGTVPGATKYRFDRRVTGSTGIAESVETYGHAWATEEIPDGSWEWRVTAYDTGNNVLGVTPWRLFRVDATRPTVTKMSPATKVARAANFAATFSEKVSGVSGTTMRLYLSGVSKPVPATVTLSSTGRVATLNPKKTLKAGKTYTVKLAGNIKDGAGNTLAATSWKVKAKK